MLDTDENPNPNQESKYKDTLIVEQMTDLRNYRILVEKLKQEVNKCNQDLRLYQRMEKTYNSKELKIENELMLTWSKSYHAMHEN